MKSTERLVDNLLNNDFRKCKIDLDHAVNAIVKRRIEEKKQKLIKKLNAK